MHMGGLVLQCLAHYELFLVVIGIKITNKPSEPNGVAQAVTPTAEPTPLPTEKPTAEPTPMPTEAPTPEPTVEPTSAPTPEPTPEPTPSAEPQPTATPNPNVTVKTEEEKQEDLGAAFDEKLKELGLTETPTVHGDGFARGGNGGTGIHYGDAQ